jgi:hypothetical protein
MIDLHKTMASLAKRRPFFCSEADFQQALAWEIHLMNGTADIRLERRMEECRLDMWIRDAQRCIIVELKYPTAGSTIPEDGEEFVLRNHGAQDLVMYGIFHDLQRVENLVAGTDRTGYVIALTNDPRYWQKDYSPTSGFSAFRTGEGREVGPKVLRPGVRILTRTESIPISGHYCLQWRQYSTIKDVRHGEFKYLLLEVKPKDLRTST